MFNKFSRSVPAKDVQMQHLHSTDTVPDAPASTPGEGAKYDDYKDGKLKFFNRMIICGIAVVLLWCTSLSIAVLIVQNFIAAPSYRDIYDTCEYAYDVSVDEKEAYHSCTDRQLSQCNFDFGRAYGNEEERVTEAFNANKATLETAAEIASTCTATYTNVVTSINLWNNRFTMNYTTVCTEDELQATRNMVGDKSALRTASFALADNFATTSTNRAHRLGSYASARADYDVQYIGNKTSGLHMDVDFMIHDVSLPQLQMVNLSFVEMDLMVDELVACVSLDNSTKCKYGVGAVDLYADLSVNVDIWVDNVLAQMTDLTVRIQAFDNAVDAAFADLGVFYNAAITTWHKCMAIQNSIPDFGSLGFDLWDPQIFPIETFFAGTFGGLADIPAALSLPSAAALFDPVKNAVSLAHLNVSVGSMKTFNVGTAWMRGLELGLGNISFVPDDYDPPVYSGMYPQQNISTDEDVQKQEKEADEFRAKTAVTLQAYDELDQTGDKDRVFFRPFNLSQMDASRYLSGYSFTMESLSSTDYDVKLWVVQLGSIGGWLVIFDYIWRAFMTCRLIFKYWNKSALNLPTADIRKDRKKFNFRTMGKRRMVLAVITSPIFFGMLAIFFLAMLIAIISAAYVPIYNQYVAACVEHTQNDTFITANLYSIAYNYASEDGNTNAYQGIDNYNVMYTDHCSTYSSSTQQQQNSDTLFFESQVLMQTQNVESLDLLNKCIDVVAMDYYYKQACCGLEGYDLCTGTEDPKYNGTCPMNTATGKPYGLVSSYLSVDECSDDFSTMSLQDGIFRCDNLPTCTLTCEGPNKQLLDSVTKQCGCMMEWGFHSGFFQITIAIIVFALLNAARTLFMRGIMILNWKKMTPNLFEYTANCRRNGKFVEPTYRQKDVPYSQLLREELDRKMKRFELMGYVLLLAAAIINVPWVIFLSLASEDIEYQPEE